MIRKEDFVADNAARLVVAELSRTGGKGKVDLDRCIDLAVALFDKLEARGLVGRQKKEGKLTSGKDFFAMLTQRQRDWFQKFWNAFDHKHGRDDAAKVWYRMGELPDEVYELIVWAAGQEASRRKQDPESHKIWAQGWLSKYRYKDYVASRPVELDTGATAEERKLLADLNAAAMDAAHWEKTLGVENQVTLDAFKKRDSLANKLKALRQSSGGGKGIVDQAREMVLRFSIPA